MGEGERLEQAQKEAERVSQRKTSFASGCHQRWRPFLPRSYKQIHMIRLLACRFAYASIWFGHEQNVSVNRISLHSGVGRAREAIGNCGRASRWIPSASTAADGGASGPAGCVTDWGVQLAYNLGYSVFFYSSGRKCFHIRGSLMLVWIGLIFYPDKSPRGVTHLFLVTEKCDLWWRHHFSWKRVYRVKT